MERKRPIRAFWGLVALVPTLLYAQNSTPKETLAAPLTLGDTGRLRSGHGEYQRYLRPSMCGSLAIRVRESAWRDKSQRFVPFAQRVRDTLPSHVVMEARQCLSAHRLSAATVLSEELLPLIQLALVANEDSIAIQATARFLSEPTSMETRTMTFYRVAKVYLEASPARIALAESILAQLDSLGPSAAIGRVYIRYAALFAGLYRLLPDVNPARKVAQEILSLVPSALAILPTVQDDQREDVEALIREADDFTREWVFQLQLAEQGPTPLVLAHLAALRDSMASPYLPVYRTGQLKLLGTPFRFPTIPYWFPPNDTTSVSLDSTRSWQRPGHATMVILVNPRYGEVNHAGYARYRRLIAQYGSRGLDVILLAQTAGYSTGSLRQTQEEEAKSIRAYFQDFLQINATVAVEVTPFSFLPHPDQRRVNGQTPFQKLYGYGNGQVFGVYVIGRDGIIQMVNGGTSEDGISERVLERVLQ